MDKKITGARWRLSSQPSEGFCLSQGYKVKCDEEEHLAFSFDPCVHVRAHTYPYAYICTCVPVHTSTHTHMHIPFHVYLPTHTQLPTCRNLHMSETFRNLHTYTYSHAYSCTCAPAYRYPHAYTCTCIPAHTHVLTSIYTPHQTQFPSEIQLGYTNTNYLYNFSKCSLINAKVTFPYPDPISDTWPCISKHI